MELLTGGAWFSIEREVGLALFARHLALLQEGRIEAVQIPTHAPDVAVLHLILGVPGVALLDSAPKDEEGGTGGGPVVSTTSAPDRVREDDPLDDLFPDFDALSPALPAGPGLG